MLALKLGPEWELEGDEAKQMETAIKRVMKHQDMQVSQKQLDYAFAAYVVATVYGTRIVATVIARRATSEAEPVPAGQSPFLGTVPFARPAS